jgi:hypothetical protein
VVEAEASIFKHEPLDLVVEGTVVQVRRAGLRRDLPLAGHRPWRRGGRRRRSTDRGPAPSGADPEPYIEAGATWWMPDLPPGTTLDRVRGVLHDGPYETKERHP